MSTRGDRILCTVLVIATIAVFWPVRNHDFLGFDDGEYISNNPHVREGLSGAGIAWAFTSFEQANFWHPLTWISLQADAQMFGVDGELLGLPASGWHHLSNLALHAANAVLLFAFLRAATGASWASFVVAGLFALHPLHVESVAWASQRKDTLSAFFGWACLLAYVRYARNPSSGRYLLALALFALGLMAKPMLVTWPFVLLLLDFWLLGRLSRASLGSRVLEKLPFLLLAAAASVVAYAAQGSAVRAMEHLTLAERLSNALVSCATYVVKAVWPSKLAIQYPYEKDLSAWTVLAALALLVAASALAARKRGRVAFGWLFFLGTLVPVIGLVQVGLHARADRYTYVPLVGLFIAVVFAIADAVGRRGVWRQAAAVAGAVVLGACAVASHRQVRMWSDTITIFSHAVAVTEGNGWAHRILGTALADAGRAEEAIPEFRIALRQWPDDPVAHNNLGQALSAVGRPQEAMGAFSEAVELDPGNAIFRSNLGCALLREGDLDAAIVELRAALRIEPKQLLALNGLGKALGLQGRMAEAAEHFREVARLDPGSIAGWSNLAAACAGQGRFDEAAAAAEEASRLAAASGAADLAAELSRRVEQYRAAVR